jgi:hypothetical protein
VSDTRPTGIDLLSFAKTVEHSIRANDRLSDALDCAQPSDRDNIRIHRSTKHGAIEITFRFDERTYIYGRSDP